MPTARRSKVPVLDQIRKELREVRHERTDLKAEIVDLRAKYLRLAEKIAKLETTAAQQAAGTVGEVREEMPPNVEHDVTRSEG